MNLITGYFTYTHLVNVIQQTVKGKVCRIFSLPLLVMLLYVATWALSMLVWAAPPVRKRTIPLPLPCPLPSACKITQKNSAKLRLLPVQRGNVSQFIKITAWRNPWNGQSIISPLLTPAAAGSLSLGVGRTWYSSPLWQWEFCCLSGPGEEKGAGMGHVWEIKGSCSKLGCTPTQRAQSWSLPGTCWPWQVKQPLLRYAWLLPGMPPLQCCSNFCLTLSTTAQ